MKQFYHVPLGDPNSAEGRRIMAAKEKADKLLAEKKKKSRDPDVDVRTFFTDEELAALLRSEESFLGSAADLDKLRRYKRICSALKWMDTYCLEVQRIEFEFVSRERPNVVAVMDVRNVSSFTGKERRVFAELYTLADTVFVSRTREGVIRFTFGVEGAWKE